MKVKVENISDDQKKLLIQVPKDKVQSEIKTVLSELRKMVKVDGFRPGKVPDGILKMRFGKTIKSEVGAKLIETSLEEALRENNIKAIGKPDLKDWELNEDTDFNFEVFVNVIPDFDVEGYKDLALEKRSIITSDEEIQEGLERIQKSEAAFVVVENRPVKNGDRVTARITLSSDESAIPGWSNRKVDIIVGENRFFPESGIEDKLIGMEKGTSRKFDVSFPENYSYYKDFAGKTIHCEIDISEIKMLKLPELDDEFAKDLGLESIDELRNQIKQDIEEQKKKDEEMKLKDQMLRVLIEKNNIPAPEILVDRELNYLRSMFVFPEDLEKEKLEEFEKTLRDRSIFEVKQRLLLDKIAEKENISVTEEEVEDAFYEECEAKQVRPDDVREKWEEEGYIEYIKQSLIRTKTKEFIWNHVKFIDESKESKQSEKKASNVTGEEKNE